MKANTIKARTFAKVSYSNLGLKTTIALAHSGCSCKYHNTIALSVSRSLPLFLSLFFFCLFLSPIRFFSLISFPSSIFVCVCSLPPSLYHSLPHLHPSSVKCVNGTQFLTCQSALYLLCYSQSTKVSST